MATKKKTQNSKAKDQKVASVVETQTIVPKWHKSMEGVMEGNETLDPQEEKILDWILKAVVVFVLGWLALGILMAIGGLFHLWG